MFKKSAIIITLTITAFLASAGNAFALLYTGGSGDGFDVAIGANADVVTIGSADQTFLVGDSATAISTITIEMEVGQAGAGINTTDDIRVKIPTSLDMVWDSTDTTATIGGSASGKVSTTVSYEDSNKTLVIDVTTNFANGDNITVSDLSFKSFNSVGYDNLELEIDNAGTTAATDSNTKTISLPASSATFTGGSGDGFDFSVGGGLTSPAVSLSSNIASTTVTATLTFTNASAIEANGDVQLTFPTSLGSGFDLSSVGANDVTEASGNGGTLTASVSSNVLTINCGSQIAASTALSFAISNVVNPNTGGSTGTFAIETQDSADNIIETGEAASLTIISYTIDAPGAGSTVPTTFTCFGSNATASATVQIKDEGSNVIGSTTADSNGKYWLTTTTALSTGAHTIQVYVDGTAGQSRSITVADTIPSGYPQISSPSNSEEVETTTPTVSGTVAASSSLTFYAKDSSGDIQSVGSGSATGSGTFSVTATTALPVGSNEIFIHDTTNSLASNIVSITVVDPYGIVFDSITNNPIQGASVTLYNSDGTVCTSGVEIAATDSNPQTTGSDGRYDYVTVNGDYYLRVSATGYTFPSTKSSFPAGRNITTGSKGETFTVAGEVLNIDLPMDAGNTLLKIEKDANKKDVVVGDIVTYTVTIKNETASDVTLVYLEDKIPPGFKYLDGKARLDGTAISDPTGNRPLTFNIGTVSANSTRTLKYQLVVGSGVTFGKYENSAHALYSDGTVISNTATETVKVIPDPLFDLGMVIGKVFWDGNENSVQDASEHNNPVIAETGISDVRIVMEDGTVIITDKDGKYHVPGVIPGRHAFRLDESTLPEGAYLTTPKVIIVDIRPGLTSKVNFGVNSEYRGQRIEGRGQRLPVKIIHERGIPQPRLNVALNKEILEVQIGGGLKEAASFRIFTNYALFIDKWSLEIFDKASGRLFKRFEGGRQTLTRPIIWSGTDDRGNLVGPGRTYVYILTVWDKHGKFDKTKEREFRVLRYQESGVSKKEELEEEIFGKRKTAVDEKRFWLIESRTNNLDLQTIRLDGETVVIKGGAFESDIKVQKKSRPSAEEVTVKVIKGKGFGEGEGLGFSEYADIEDFQQDIIVPKGEHTVVVEAKDAKGEKTECTKNIKVGDDYFFFIAMGDGEMGYNFIDGATEPIEPNDHFKKGLWLDGKLAYYLKAKIKGKYLITSSLDTQRDQKELFRYIDPDKYYPVYGDNSTLIYEATDTQGMLYAMVEWDRSKVMWGNYNVAFTDTEFAQFSRTLYGGKIQLISTSDTKFGEPNTKIITFMAKAKQKAAHNEFVGTGGSLYYLKHKYVAEGSDKLRIEVRDKITGLVLSTLEQKEGSDYQIDYDNGRIIFWKPVSQIAESESIISTRLLDGNKLYVVADYEYYTKDKYDEWSKGARVSQQLGDYLRIGGTYVEDEQEAKKNFELKGVDTTLRLGKDIKFDAEYAETKSEEGNNFISTDGGLSFSELATSETAEGKTYGLKGEARLFERLGLSGYYKKTEKGFSTPFTIANQGTEKMGGAASLDILPGTRISARHDIQKLLEDGNLESRAQVGAEKTETTTVQLMSELTKKLEVTGEYRHQKVSGKKEQYESETNEDTDIVAGRLAYKPTDKLELSVKHQESLSGKKNRQTTVGAETKLNKYISLRAAETVGTKGNATTVGAGANIEDRLDLFADYTLSNGREDGRGRTVTAGGKVKVDDKSSLYNTYSITDSDKGQKRETVVFGAKKELNNGYEVTMGREFSKESEKLASANTYGVAKEIAGRRIEGTYKQETANEEGNASITNIFGLSGDINDKLAGTLSFEKGEVQNLDGTQTKRIAASGGVSYVDKDKIKASSKLEFRHDDAAEDSWQILAYNAVEGKVTQDLTLFGKANIAHTENSSTDSTTADFKEMVLGAAYRPIYHDKLNLIGKYTFLEDESPASQSDFKDIDHIRAHVFGLEAVYDVTDKFQLVEKGAYKYGEEKVSGFDFTKTQTWLLVNRLNYNLTRDWQIGGEYRMLSVVQAEDLKQGALVEASRRIGEFVRVGAGYNFTDFSDDLTDLDYTVHGPFVRMTGLLYDRTPQEIERLRKRVLEENIKRWAWELVNEELARPDSEIMQELYNYFYLAKLVHDEGRLKESKELYAKIQDAGKKMYEEAEGYIRGRVELEKQLKSYNELAKIYYKEGRLLEARELWKKIIIEAKAEPISLEF